MTQIIILLLFSLITVFTPANENKYKLNELRESYLEASKNAKASKQFHKLMLSYNKQHPVVLAYKGASEAAMAKHVWNPYSKLKHVNNALSWFEQAVELDKKNAEIRFLRFTVEHYVPRYLNLSQHLEEDKRVVIAALKKHPDSGLPTDLAQTIHKFMLTKDHLTEEEKVELQNVSIN